MQHKGAEKMSMSRLSLIVAVLAGCALSAAAEPRKLWEATGFENPESALVDAAAAVIYVSNMAGEPLAKDGNGFLSKVALDGKVVAPKWVTGLDAPKGLALSSGKLYVADIDKLVEIDAASGEILVRHEAPGAKFLNDVAADTAGTVYVSDMVANTIWRLAGGKLEPWLASDALMNPNGLVVDSGTLVVAAWGVMTDGFSTKVPGHLLAITLTDKSLKALGDGTPVGNLDGLEPLDAQHFIATDWMAGTVYRIARGGAATKLLTLSQGSADLGFDPATRTAYVPMMNDGKLMAFRLE